MFDKAFDDIVLGDLHALVEAGVPEGRRLEFKRDYGRTDELPPTFPCVTRGIGM